MYERQFSTPLVWCSTPARVEQHGRFRGPPDFGGAHDAGGRHARDRFRNSRRIALHEIAHRLETLGLILDELAVDPVALDHDVQDSIGKSAVSSRAQGRNKSAVRAIGVMRGSMTIIFAPLSRARQM